MPRFGTGADLARELGISRVAVHKAEKSGRISRTADGKFDLEAAAIQYRLHTNPEQSRRALAQQGQGATAALTTPLGADDWRTRLQRAETEKAEIELAKLKGTVATTESIESASARAAYAIVGALVPLPDRIASECGETDAQRRKIRQITEREIDRVRAEISEALKHGPQ